MVLLRSPLSPTELSTLAFPQSSGHPELITCDVAIVGGGIVGLTLATALKQSGLKVMLLDNQPRTAALHKRRAYAITLLSGRIFDGLGVWSDILPQITTFQAIRLADATCPAVVDLQPEDLGTPQLGYVAEHFVLAQALQQTLADMDSLLWWDRATVNTMERQTSGAVLLVNRDNTPYRVEAQLVVAADGARSPLRQQMGIKTDGWKYWQSCVTAVIRPQQVHQDIAREHFWPSGPFATLPLPDNRCQIVLTAPHTEAQRYMDMSDAEFLDVLDQRYGNQLGSLELVTPRSLFPVQLMHSRHYVQPCLALIGDAAHCCHPVGGQGMNLGIRDAAALAQVLTTAHQRGQNLGSLTVLKQYERWRWWENLIILGFTDTLDRTFSSAWWPLQWSRRMVLRLMRQQRWLKTIALWLMTGGLGRSPQLAVSERKS
ncbi:MAG: FAD-dependent hydroxylase [Cyanothece sp. SIO2G6]|nr:FAD-dependent hydroxylase [Cyanothece sp. SIO2G6]